MPDNLEKYICYISFSSVLTIMKPNLMNLSLNSCYLQTFTLMVSYSRSCQQINTWSVNLQSLHNCSAPGSAYQGECHLSHDLVSSNFTYCLYETRRLWCP